MSKKIVDLDNITRFASALDSRIKNKIAIEELRAKVEETNLSQTINQVEQMLGGKSLVYITQAEYDVLSDNEKNNEDEMYFITDAEDLSHVHDNLELLNSLDEEYFVNLDSEIGELTTNIAKVESMLGGKSLVYLTQDEYDILSEEEKNDESIIYCITDAEDTSHTHDNLEFLNSLNETDYMQLGTDIADLKNSKVNKSEYETKISELTTNITNEIDRAIEKENELSATIAAEVARVENMLGGKSFVYLTQAEYDSLTDEEKNNESIMYCITDAIDTGNASHEHANKEFLDGLNQEVLDAKQDKEDQNLLTENKTIVGAINELQALSEEFDATLGNFNLEDMGNDIFDLQAKAIELETYKADKEYVDSKLSTKYAITLNGYSIWVGTAEELEQIVERDPNTLYFEIDNDNDDQEEVETVQNISPVNNVLTLTTNKYQKTVIANETEIVFPQVTELTELHLYFDKNDNDEMNLILPDNCKWRVDPNIEDASAYELIAVYNTSYWLVNIVSYSDDNTLSL